MKKISFIFVLLVYLLGSIYKAVAQPRLMYLKNSSSYTIDFHITAHDGGPGPCGSLNSTTITLAPWSTQSFYNITDLSCSGLPPWTWVGCPLVVGSSGWGWESVSVNCTACGGTAVGYIPCTAVVPVGPITLTCAGGILMKVIWIDDGTGNYEVGIDAP